MESTINTHKSKHIAHQANEKGDALVAALIRPSGQRNKRSKDLFGAVLGWRQVDDGDQDAKEADNVQDQDEALKLGEQRADPSIDDDTKDHRGPKQQHRLVRLRLVRVWVGEAD